MNILATYIRGWGSAFKHYKMWGLYYVFNFLFALLLTFPVFKFLETKLANTLVVDKLYEQFDFTIFNDILNEYGDIFGILTNQSLIATFLFLLLAVFLTGGILQIFKHRTQAFSFGTFWEACSHYFWRILGLTLIFLLLHGVLLFGFKAIFDALTAGGLTRFNSEVEIYKRAMLLFPFYGITAIVFWMIQDYTKVLMIAEDLSLFRSLQEGIRFVFKNFMSTFLLYLINLLVFGLLFYLYWQIPTGNAFLFAFVLGQVFLFFRIGTKLANLASASIWQRYKMNRAV